MELLNFGTSETFIFTTGRIYANANHSSGTNGYRAHVAVL